MNFVGMRSVIVCRKTVLIPVVPEISGGYYSYEEVKALKLVLSDSSKIAGDGMFSIPIRVWRKQKLQRFFKPLETEEGGAMKRRKIFPCDHTGFGDYCHRCKPNTPRDKESALAGKYGSKVQRKEKSKSRKEVRNNGKEKIKVSAKGGKKKKQQVKRKGVRGKASPPKHNDVG